MSIRKATTALEHLRKLIKSTTNTSGFDCIYDKIRVVSGGEGKLHAELDITAAMLNRHGALHGGMTALLVDAASTYALTTVAEGKMGVSTDLNISYFKPVFENDTVVIQATTLKCGKSLGVGTVDIINKVTGDLIAHGRQTKFMAGSKIPDNFT